MSAHHKLFDWTEKEWKNDFKGHTLAVSLHTHSDNSLDGGSTVEDMMDRAYELGYSHFTLSEHGNVNSAARIFSYADKMKKKGKNIKPFHSVEAYLKFPEDKKSTHITIGFKTQEAFEFYCKLTPKLFSVEQIEVKYGDVKPVITVPQFEQLAQLGITVGTGCIGSWLNRPLMPKTGEPDVATAEARLKWMIGLVGEDNIFDEWIVDDLSNQYVGATYDATTKKLLTPPRLEQNPCNPYYNTPDVGKVCNCMRRDRLLNRYRNIRPIASLDAHYARKSDKIVQDAKNYGSDWVMSSFQHLRGAEEFAHEAMKNQGLSEDFVIELIKNTHVYASKFDGYKFRTSKDGWLLPQYPDSNREYLWNKMRSLGRLEFTKEVIERLEYEMSVLNPNPTFDALSYMRLASEIVDLANENGILVNARGSVGGSLLAYCLGITVTDPLKYDLPFERFMTLGRIKSGMLPDADLDFSDKEKMMRVLSEKYGDRMMPIGVDSLLKPRSAIKDAERAILGSVRFETELMTKQMPNVPQGVDETDWLFGYEDENGSHVQGYIETSKVLQEYAEKNKDIWDLVKKMCGVQRQKSRHACGILITPKPIHEYMPLYRVGGKNGELVTAWEPKDIEYIGGVKLDILGVTKMMTVQECVKLIKERHNVDLPWGEYPHDDEVYQNVFWTGDTEGTFQTNTPGITTLARDAKLASIPDIADAISLYRPSCLDASPTWDEDFKGNLVDYYVKYRKKELNPKFIHQDLIPIYGTTASAPIYQEQILKTFRDIGGYSFEEAEGVRRAIGKKDAAALAEHGKRIKEACFKRGWSEQQATALFDMIMASGRYGFNAGHATSYAIVSYNTAYLKYKYPLEFWAAELSCEYDNIDKINAYYDYIKDMILQPDILKSHPTNFLIEGDKIRAPICMIKGVGEAVIEDLQKLLFNDIEALKLERRKEQIPVPRAKKKA